MNYRRLVLSALVATVLVLVASVDAADEQTNTIGMKLIRIAPGTFEMGSNQGRDYWDESPVHNVTISRPFYISETEVTIEQFRQFRPDFKSTAGMDPYAAGLSWYDAEAFCRWLTKKEGKPYRLPTEAEWEYTCRAGTSSLYFSGDKSLQSESANPWGLKNMNTGVLEWCFDWYGNYPAQPQIDPVGPEAGMAKVVRGGPLDGSGRTEERNIFDASSSRASIAPAFGRYPSGKKSPVKKNVATGQAQPGLIGTWFGEPDLSKAKDQEVIAKLDQDWSQNDSKGDHWSARWRGLIEGPTTGEVTFEMTVATGGTLTIDGKALINAWSNAGTATAKMNMVKGKKYPVVITYNRAEGDSNLRISWSWSGTNAHPIGGSALSYSPADEASAKAEGGGDDDEEKAAPGSHKIGFRIVQAPMHGIMPLAYQTPYVQQAVQKKTAMVTQAPDATKPFFRKRYLFPTPHDNRPNAEIDAVAMAPYLRHHCHSPALEVCPNGDVLMVIYSSYDEYEPGVSLIAARLRLGADLWDMPEKMFDFAAANDHAPMLYTEGDTMYFFWGNPKLQGGFPFNWTISHDSAATWEEIKFPKIVGKIGSHSRQPVNTALRDKNGTLYFASDASGGHSLLWATGNNGLTWYDTGGRTNGRHTTFALLSDGTTILGMGGKNTDIDGFMPKSISTDGGKTYTFSKTPFASLGSNQRPCVLKLKSGRLLFVGDFQNPGGRSPEGVTQRGCYAALSDDDGKTWHIKKLVGTQQHEDKNRNGGADTLGYSAARQGPNGMIHLITTMTRPCLHFEFNEAFILSDNTGYENASDAMLMKSSATKVAKVKQYSQQYPSGRRAITYSGGIGDDGRFLLEGHQVSYYKNGHKQHEATYKLGRKVGTEMFWNINGSIGSQWQHNDDGSSVWTQYWPNGKKKAQSRWRNFKAEGTATLWDIKGNVTSQKKFVNGEFAD